MKLPDSAAFIERVALLAEEMAEAQQVIGKILRHGSASTHPDGGPQNLELLAREIGDVKAAIAIMNTCGDFSVRALREFRDQKLRRVGKYLHAKENQRAAELLAPAQDGGRP